MKTSLPPKPILLILAATLLAAGCVIREHRHGEVFIQAPPSEIYVTEAPPEPRRETIIVAPDPAYVWVPGGWIWEGRWVWEAGRWMRPPNRGAVWAPHHYDQRGGRRVWIRGGWR